jgi:hypothetical protein
VVSFVWHPDKGLASFSLPEYSPHWTFYLGIVFTGMGAGLVLYSKEKTEAMHASAPAPVTTPAIVEGQGS